MDRDRVLSGILNLRGYLIAVGYFRRCQRVFFNIFRCLCLEAFFFRHFLTEPILSPPFDYLSQIAANSEAHGWPVNAQRNLAR